MLVRKYLQQVFHSPGDYRRILAVTFTNKAADEMKSRLLYELDLLDKSPLKSKHLEFLKEEFKQSDSWVQQSASLIKSQMLHDFTRISVGTIDSFFQQVLRSFARESGLSSTFQLQLDTDLVLEKFSRFVFTEAKVNDQLMTWLVEWVNERMENRETWHKLEADLVRLGYELLKEDILALMVSDQSAVPAPEDINRLKNECRKIIKDFNDAKSNIAAEAAEIVNGSKCSINDFSYGKGGPAGCLLKFADSKDGPHDRARASRGDPDKWVSKKSPAAIRDEIIHKLYPDLNKLLEKAIRLYDNDEGGIRFNSARAINKNLYALGFASFLFDYFKSYFNENNQLLLSLAQPLVNQIIGDNPTPFIYEKTGTYYNHFLIDEFQDTSDLQWKNFKPLIVDSLSAGGLSMVVGDIKQSLYRWRNSNWRLLHQTAVADLQAFGSTETPLDNNQRSRKSIIEFNNRIFKDLPAIVADHLKLPYDEEGNSDGLQTDIIRSVFKGSEQGSGAKADREGRVEIRFLNKSEPDWNEKLEKDLPRLVADLLDNKGYRQEDITFLVRKNNDADKITRILAAYGRNWTFVSSDVFKIGNSPVIKIILNGLRFIADPRQTLYRDLFLWDTFLRSNDGNPPAPGFQAAGLDNFQAFIDSVSFSDLLTITDELVHTFKLDAQEDDLAYIFQFRDQIKSCMDKGISHLDGFLTWWDTSGHKLMLVAESTGTAMRIMTIHKAKGLSSPVVIIPYCNWEFNHRASRAPWLWVNSDQLPFNTVKTIPVRYDSILEQSFFAGSYKREKIDCYLDNLDLLYVAFTRAIDVIIVFCPYGKSFTSVADALYLELKPDLPEDEVFRLGDPEFNNQNVIAEILPEAHLKTPMIAGKLKSTISHRVDSGFESTRYGKNVHLVLESVRSMDDLAGSIDRSVGEGLLTRQEGLTVQEGISRLFNISEMADWFSGSWEVWNETGILVPRYGEKRPDRVMIRNGKVVIVDYKTGAREQKHSSQVASYMKLLASMGYNEVKGYLLYLEDGILEEVRSQADSFQPGLFDQEA